MLNFSNIISFLKRNKKILYYTGFFVVLFMIGSGDVFATETAAQIAETKKVQGWISFLNGLMVGLASMMSLMTYLVTMFLDPAWLNGSLFEMNTYFKDIWILVSNVVYFIFAFILIGIAFMNIIGKGDKWELKSVLPKFIIGVLIVPFSWFFIQFILSLSAILTASVLTLPADNFSEYKDDLKKITIPEHCILNYGSSSGSTSGSSTGGIIDCEGYIFGKVGGPNSQTLIKAFESGNIEGAIFGSLAIYTYGVVSFDKLGKLDSSAVKESIKTIGDFIFKVVFDILFVLVFAILMVTLGLVLIVRGVYIWIYTMMSPIFGLMYFFDKKEGGGDGFFGKFNVGEFIALAMVPVYVMAALSFGFLFINVVSKGIQSHTSSGVNGPISITGSTISIGDFKLTINGSLSSTKGKSILGHVSQGAGTIMGLIGGLIMQLFSIIVLRGAVMAALRSSTITKTLTEPIYKFGNDVGGLVAKSPMYAPVFGGGQSMSSLSATSGAVSSSIQTSASTKGNKFANDHFGDFMGSDKSKKIRDINVKVAGNGLDAKQNIIDGLKEAGSGQEAYNNSALKNIVTGKNLDMLESVNTGLKSEFNAVRDAKSPGAYKIALARLNVALPEMYRFFDKSVNNADKVEDAIKNNTGTSTPDSSNGGDNKITVSRITEDGKHIDIKINNSTIRGERESNGSVSSFTELGYKEIAEYVNSNSLDKNGFKKLMQELKIDDSNQKYIKGKIAQYFKDGVGNLGEKTGKVTDLDKFLKKNEPKSPNT